MSSSAPKTQSPLPLLAGASGLFLLAYLVHRAGPAKLLASITTLGWGLVLVLLWGGVAHIVNAFAWRLTLLDDKRHVSFARLLGLRQSDSFCCSGEPFPETVASTQFIGNQELKR